MLFAKLDEYYSEMRSSGKATYPDKTYRIIKTSRWYVWGVNAQDITDKTVYKLSRFQGLVRMDPSWLLGLISNTNYNKLCFDAKISLEEYYVVLFKWLEKDYYQIRQLYGLNDGDKFK